MQKQWLVIPTQIVFSDNNKPRAEAEFATEPQKGMKFQIPRYFAVHTTYL